MKLQHRIPLLLLFLLISTITLTHTRAAAMDILITTDSEYNIGYGTDSTYKSTDTKILTVSKQGIVKGKKAGSASVIVTSKKNKKLKQTITFSVKETSISPNGQKSSDAKVYYEDKHEKNTKMKKESPIIKGENVIVNYSTTLTSTKPVKWSISDPSKATLSYTSTYSTSCTITGKEIGAVFIIATDKNGYTTKLPYAIISKPFFSLKPSNQYKVASYKNWFTLKKRVCNIQLSKTGTYTFETTMESTIKCTSDYSPGYKSGFKVQINNNSITVTGKYNKSDKYLKYESGMGIPLCSFTATCKQTGEKIYINFFFF